MEKHCKALQASQESFARKDYVKNALSNAMAGLWKNVQDLFDTVSKMVDWPNDEFKEMKADFKKCVGENQAQFLQLDASLKEYKEKQKSLESQLATMRASVEENHQQAEKNSANRDRENRENFGNLNVALKVCLYLSNDSLYTICLYRTWKLN